MNKIALGAGAGIVLAALAGYGALVYPTARARAEVDAAIAQLPPEVSARYGSLHYSLFSGTLDLGAVEIAVKDGDDTVTTRIASLALRDLAKDRVGALKGSGITLENGDRSTHVEAEQLTGEQWQAAEGVLTSLSGIPAAVTLKRLALTGISVTTPEDTVKLNEIVLADYVQADRMPRSLALGVHGLKIDPKALPDQEARDNLAKLGYDALSLNFDVAYTLDPEAKRLSIKNAAIGGDNVGRLSFALDVGSLPVQALGDPVTAMAAAQGATLERLELRYDDSSLANRLLKLAAAEAQMPEPEFRTALLAQLTQAGAQAPDTVLTRQMIDSATAFLNEPKSLSLQLKPAQPLPLWQMMGNNGDPYALAQALGMSVSANR